MKNLRVELKTKPEFCNNQTQYFNHKDRLYSLTIWGGFESFEIIDLTDAGRRGKVCYYLSVRASRGAEDCAIWNYLLSKHWEKLLEAATSQMKPEEIFTNDFSVHMGKYEAVRLLALDLSVYKPLTEVPKKWTIPHLIRLIVNQQFENFRCNYREVDDGLNMDRSGPIENHLAFIERIIKSPSGWWTRYSSRGENELDIVCHSFDSNSLRVKIENKKPAPKKDTNIKLAQIETNTSIETIEEAQQFLKSEGIKVTDTMTEPTKAGKSPRPVWQVSGRTDGFEEIFYNLGCSKRRWRGAFSFWECDPSLAIAQSIREQGRLSFAEQQERKEERAATKAQRYQEYSDNAAERANQLFAANKKMQDCMAGTPILIGHHSEKRHRKEIEKMDNRMRKSIEEDKKSSYFSDRADSIIDKLENQKKRLPYLDNKIKAYEAVLREVESRKANFSDYESRINSIKERIDYFKNLYNEEIKRLKDLGHTIPTSDTIDQSDLINYRGTWYPVKRVNKKSVTISNWLDIPKFTWSVPYS